MLSYLYLLHCGFGDICLMDFFVNGCDQKRGCLMGQWGEEVEVNAVFNGKGYRVRLIPHFETEAFRPISKGSTLESVVVVNVEKEEKDSE